MPGCRAERSLEPANAQTMMLLAQASSTDPTGATTAFLAAFGIVYAIVILACVAFAILCYCVVAKKAGYNPWLGLLMLVPIANLIVALIFVFGEWPIQTENRALRARLGIPPNVPVGAASMFGVAIPPPPAAGPITPA